MSVLKIQVDADNLLGRQFNELERQQLPYAVVRAVNAVAWEVRTAWQDKAMRVFDRPTPMTRNAVLYTKASKQRLYADIFLRDEAYKGTPPAKYLLPEVEGGERRKKGFELLLQARGVMPAGQFAIAGRGAKLDGYGNVRASQISQILSQTGNRQDALQNQTDNSTARRRARRRKRGQEYFVVQKRRGRLQPGIYERAGFAFGSAVRSVFIFASHARYQPRYDIFGYTQRVWDRLMPFYFNRELDKAVQDAMARVRA